jgi:hypothetical protein
VWVENRFSMAFRLDLARRFGLGGVVVESAAKDDGLPDVWNTVLAYAEERNVHLETPYGPYLQPAWRATEGQVESAARSGSAVWRAPQRAGVFDVTLVVSDGVLFIGQKLSLRVAPPAATATPGGTSTSTPTATATPAR